MKRLNSKYWFLLSLVTYLLCPFSLLAFNAHQPFDISSDILDYVDETQEVTARGHVVIVQSSSTLTADLVRYDRIHRRLIARGKVMLKENGSVMLGDQMDYNLDEQKGIMLGGKGYSSTWFFQGASWEKNEDYYIGRNASFTSCDLIDPHYHIKSSRIHLIPDRLFWAWNNVVYSDDKPVFYTPFMYKYLDQQRVVFQAQPGSDSLLGAFAKTTTTMRFNDHFYDKLYLDFYSVAGKGMGDELDFEKPGHYKGSLFGYYIDPHPDALLPGAPTGPQYNFRGYLWDQLTKTTQVQANTNLRQNISFNTQYFSQDPNQSQNDVLSSIALTQQTTTYNQHIVIQREDAPDAGDTSPFATTHVQNASLPAYSFTLFERPLWSPKSTTSIASGVSYSTMTRMGMIGPFMPMTSTFGPVMVSTPSAPMMSIPQPSKIGPILFSMTGGAQDQYLRVDDQTHASANSVFNVSENFPFARKWTYNTRISPEIDWQDKGPTTGISTDTQKGFTGRTTFGNVLRWRPFSSLTVDTGHTLTERLKPNDIAFARDTTDHGVEANNITWNANYRPNSKVLFRSSSGFDFRRLDDESLLDYEQRKWMPWSTDWTYDPNKRWEYYVSNSVGFYPTRTQSWQASARYMGLHKTLVSGALVYNRSSPGELTWNQSFGYYFGPGWRVDIDFNALVPATSGSSVRDANIVNTNVALVRDMHCWQTEFIFHDTPPFSRSFSLLFNLKLGGKASKPIPDQDLEAQFYPWRDRSIDPMAR